MEFNDWMNLLLEYAGMTGGPAVESLIANAQFMYEDYHEQGMTPEEAYHAEWG